MNNKLKKIIIIFFILLFAVFISNVFLKGIKTNEPDITNMNILNYIPINYELTILSNSTNKNIKNYIKKNIPEEKKEELNLIKDSILSYLGFNLQEKIENIYDNEFAITFFRNELNKKDILLIFKLKNNKNINNIINSDEELDKSDHIFELKRLGKINYISHILLTKDNYIIASSNKKLIDSSVQSDNTRKQILPRNLIPEDINLKKIKLLSISKYIGTKNSSNPEIQKFNELITILDYENNKIKLRSFSPNINKINTEINNSQIDDIKDIILTNKYSKYRKNINFLYNDINQKEFIEEIIQELDEELLFITYNNNWVFCFKSKLPNKISIDEFNFLKNYKKEELFINNINYSIYTNDQLKIKDNNISYEKENPIFSLKDEETIYISNDFDTLLNIAAKANLSDQYSKYNSEIESHKFIFNDILFIKSINNKQLFKYYESLKNLQYFLNTELFSLDDIKINISQIIPEQNEKVYLESTLKIF